MAERLPLVGQRTGGDVDGPEDCGEAVGASIITLRTGQPIGVHAFADEMRARGGESNVRNGTDWPHLAPVFEAHGLRHYGCSNLDDVAAAHARGDHTMILIHDNRNADADIGGPLFHWIGGYGGRTDVMNPWAPKYVTYADSQLGPAFIEAHAITGGLAPSPPPDPEKEPMTPSDRLDVALALTRIVYAAQLHRWEPGEGGAYAQAIAGGASFDSTIESMLRSPESLADMDSDFKRDHPPATGAGATPTPEARPMTDDSPPKQVTAVIDGEPSFVQLETRNDQNGVGHDFVAIQSESGGAARVVALTDTAAVDALIAQSPQLAALIRPESGAGGGDDGADSPGFSVGEPSDGPGAGDSGVTTGETGGTDTSVDSGAPGGSYADSSPDSSESADSGGS